MGKLDGMVAWVTGAGRMRGLGRAMALRLAEDGADVMVTAIRRDASEFPAHDQCRRRISDELKIKAGARYDRRAA
jgi:NAD(P)-dependent dehydrogenase (short-subunit alcohol dehydrogenase family)